MCCHNKPIFMNNITLLSKREAEIAERIAWGQSVKEVADALHISVFTCETHMKNIHSKLHINKANELAAMWFCHKYGISMDLSPMKRAVTTLCLLALFIFHETQFNDEWCRRANGRRVRTEQVVRRKTE